MNDMQVYLDQHIFTPAEELNTYVTDLYVNSNYAKLMKKNLGFNFDCETHWQVIQIGIVGYYRGANIHINNEIPYGFFLCNIESK